jgi:hypothetical protein
MNTLPVPEVKELCQWEKKLYEQMSSPATFEKLWNEAEAPKRECVVYEWEGDYQP